MSEQINRVLAYYKSTNFDYEHFWSGRRALAIHFGYYDSSVDTHEDSLIKMNQVLAGYADIKASDKVLDAGCGYGGSSIWLAENIGCEATGLTVVPYQVNKAEKCASSSVASSKLHFVKGDYAHTNMLKNSYNVVWGLESIVHCENKKGFIKEAYRILKPSGRILISEYLLRDQPKLSKAERDTIEPFLKGWMMPDLLTPTQYKELLTKAGFKNIKIYDLSKNVDPSLRKCRRNASMAMPFVGILQKIGLIDEIRRDYTVANYKLYDYFKAGLWQYKVVVATKP
jgi:tocopherol O-methyltransferase